MVNKEEESKTIDETRQGEVLELQKEDESFDSYAIRVKFDYTPRYYLLNDTTNFCKQQHVQKMHFSYLMSHQLLKWYRFENLSADCTNYTLCIEIKIYSKW